MKYEYNPKGTCSKKMIFEIENEVIKEVEIIGGCPGNLKGISRIIRGMKLDEVIVGQFDNNLKRIGENSKEAFIISDTDTHNLKVIIWYDESLDLGSKYKGENVNFNLEFYCIK